ncbi:hypothetical protein OG559_11690 [Micromonospora sp. NBC_01405]
MRVTNGQDDRSRWRRATLGEWAALLGGIAGIIGAISGLLVALK